MALEDLYRLAGSAQSKLRTVQAIAHSLSATVVPTNDDLLCFIHENEDGPEMRAVVGDMLCVRKKLYRHGEVLEVLEEYLEVLVAIEQRLGEHGF
jgi:hypothetical protein